MKKISAINTLFQSFDGSSITTYYWKVDQPKFCIHIIHGMSEYAGRYDDFAKWLNSKEISVFSSDLRGHGLTAREIKNVGFFDAKDGWNKVVKDLFLIHKKFTAEISSVPNIILGHSLGSLLARSLSIDYKELTDAFIFSASSDHPGIKGIIGKPIAKLSSLLFGKRKSSKFLDFLTYADFNKRIKNIKTKKDWLSREESVVKDYINDPYCMQIFSNQFFTDLAYGILNVNKSKRIALMDPNTPILLLSGKMDPVGNYGKGIVNIAKKFKNKKINKLTVKLFEDGRHEMLNELNKVEVYNYIYTWIQNTLK